VHVFRPLLIAATLVASIGAAEVVSDSFAVGVMRRDGTLIPFASFNGKRWTSDWPAPTTMPLEIPINVTSVPRPWWGGLTPRAEWQVWTGASQSRVARATQPDFVDVHCFKQIALKTDYRSTLPLPPPGTQPYPKDGLAISPPRDVEPIESLTSGSTEGAELLGLVSDAFNKAEREMAGNFTHPVKPKTREAVPVQVEAVYAYGKERRVYYVEAARGYVTDVTRQDQCRIAFGTGWFARGLDGKLIKLDMAVDLLMCNRYGATYMLPLGIVRVGTRTFWMSQYSGWDHERFMVAELTQKKIEALVVKGGGGC
jgi:hypothetical protein